MRFSHGITTQRPWRQQEAGSALFIILIVIVLFGALSFAVVQMLRSGNPELITEEQKALYGDEILDYGRALRQTVQNIRISNGCEAEDISFENTVLGGYTHSPVASDACKIFNVSGGGMNYRIPPEEWLDTSQSAQTLYQEWYATGATCAVNVGSGTTTCESDGDDNEELVAIVPYVMKSICIAINERMGITNPGGDPPANSGTAFSLAQKYDGSFTDGIGEINHANLYGKLAGCFEGSGTPPSGTYHFYQVLIAR